ncbi:MAG: metallophosphoesterase family protein [Thermodesulfobacteriota bacterium]|nr:metallophosphoesterase family protein [Thermodesulfobacteriota bacterium]
MEPIRIGVISDTHLYRQDDIFRARAAECFSDVSMVLHAGDLVELSILNVFAGKEVHAVRGNMCHASVTNVLPQKKIINVGRFTIGLIHGDGYLYDIEAHLLNEFESVDCIVYGHTHKPVNHWIGPVLFVNPGTFRGTGKYGAQGTYAIIEAGNELHAVIHRVAA